MTDLVPGIIMAFREGLEAFLIVAIILKFLEKSQNKALKKFVWLGILISIILSLLLGFILFQTSTTLSSADHIGKLWESAASLLAVSLVITFIIQIIKHGKHLKRHIEEKTALSLSAIGILALSTFLIAREGVEIAIFTFAGDYPASSVLIGLALATITAVLISLSLIKANFKTIFNITLAYLILQAGYLLGYGIHEGIEALKSLSYIKDESIFLMKAFNFSDGLLNHKTGAIGLPLHILFGWYSKPEWLSFLAQYLTTASLFIFWVKYEKK